jgi:AraC family transcriptional activator of pobA
VNLHISNKRALRVTSIAALMKHGSWRLEALRSSNCHCFVWITKGHGKLIVDGQDYGFGPNTAGYIPAFTMHAFHLGKGSQGWIIHADREILNLPPQNAGVARLNNLFDQAEICASIDNINREITNDRDGMAAALGAHATLLALTFARKLEIHAPPPKPNSDGKAAGTICFKFMELLATDISAHHTVAYFSEKLGITPTHLSRVCKQRFGRPASELVHDRLVSEAKARLINSGDKIGAIGHALGFGSSAYFSRLFKQKTGQSPAQFRQITSPEALF